MDTHKLSLRISIVCEISEGKLNMKNWWRKTTTFHKPASHPSNHPLSIVNDATASEFSYIYSSIAMHLNEQPNNRYVINFSLAWAHAHAQTAICIVFGMLGICMFSAINLVCATIKDSFFYVLKCVCTIQTNKSHLLVMPESESQSKSGLWDALCTGTSSGTSAP